MNDEREPHQHHDADHIGEGRERSTREGDPRERGRQLVDQLGVPEKHEERPIRTTAHPAESRGRVDRARAEKPEEDRRDRRGDDERVERSLQHVDEDRGPLHADRQKERVDDRAAGRAEHDVVDMHGLR